MPRFSNFSLAAPLSSFKAPSTGIKSAPDRIGAANESRNNCLAMYKGLSVIALRKSCAGIAMTRNRNGICVGIPSMPLTKISAGTPVSNSLLPIITFSVAIIA